MQFDQTFTRTLRAKGAGCALLDDSGRILLVQQARVARGSWHLPMGTVEPLENPQDAALREAGEEARLEVELLKFVDAYLGVYEDGTYVLRLVWLARAKPGQLLNLEPDEEIMNRGWFALEQMENMYARGELRMHHTLLAARDSHALWAQDFRSS